MTLKQEYWEERIEKKRAPLEQAQRHFEGRRQSYLIAILIGLILGPIFDLLLRSPFTDASELMILGYLFVAVWLFYLLLYSTDFLERMQEYQKTLPRSKKKLAKLRKTLIRDAKEVPRTGQRMALGILCMSFLVVLLEAIYFPALIRTSLASLFGLLLLLFITGVLLFRRDRADFLVDQLLNMLSSKRGLKVRFAVTFILILLMLILTISIVVEALLSIVFYDFLPFMIILVISELGALYFLDKLTNIHTKQSQNSRKISELEKLERDIRHRKVKNDEDAESKLRSIMDMKSHAW